MYQIQIVPSAARTTNGTSSAQSVDDPDALCIGIVVTAVGGTPSMTCTVTWSHDGVNFGAGETAVSFAAITGVKQTTQRIPPQAPWYRVEWAITGTTPSLTFSVYAWSA